MTWKIEISLLQKLDTVSTRRIFLCLNILLVAAQLLFHAQQLPYFLCAGVCLLLFILKTVEPSFDGNTGTLSIKTVDLLLSVGLTIISFIIFRTFFQVDTETIEEKWLEVKQEESIKG